MCLLISTSWFIPPLHVSHLVAINLFAISGTALSITSFVSLFKLDFTYELEKEMAPYSSILAWRIPWTEEPGRLQSMGSQRVRHNWVTNPHTTYKWYWYYVIFVFACLSSPNRIISRSISAAANGIHAVAGRRTPSRARNWALV